MRRYLVVVIVFAAVAIPAIARAAPWYWSETFAETMVIQKVHLPCRDVFATGDTCNFKLQQKYAALLKQKIAACEAMPASEAYRCTVGLSNTPYADAPTYVGYIRNGIRVAQANCIGTGSPDSSGFRFTRFRCTIIVQDDLAHGRLNVVVTGKTTFHWQVI